MSHEKENVLGIDFRQVDQDLRNSGKLVPQTFSFNKIDICNLLKSINVFRKGQVRGKWL